MQNGKIVTQIRLTESSAVNSTHKALMAETVVGIAINQSGQTD
jgi:hypothetical protein